jgi:hypothetical protein
MTLKYFSRDDVHSIDVLELIISNYACFANAISLNKGTILF